MTNITLDRIKDLCNKYNFTMIECNGAGQTVVKFNHNLIRPAWDYLFKIDPERNKNGNISAVQFFYQVTTLFDSYYLEDSPFIEIDLSTWEMVYDMETLEKCVERIVTFVDGVELALKKIVMRNKLHEVKKDF